MNQAITIAPKTVEQILTRLDALTKEVKSIKAKLLVDQEPPYGSDEWWEWSDKKAIEDIKAGRYSTVHNKKELQHLLDSLKTK